VALQGTGSITIEDETKEFKADYDSPRIFTIRPGMTHTVRNIGSANLVLLCLLNKRKLEDRFTRIPLRKLEYANSVDDD